MPIAVIVHGGAWDIPLALRADHIAGCRAATDAAWVALSAGNSALDAVEAAIRVMEDHPVFDAGTGAHLNRDGEVELDAGIMDGTTLQAGAVGAVKRVRNPITLARRVLDEGEHVLLVASGAERFAEHVGLPLCNPNDLIVERELQLWQENKLHGHVPSAGFISQAGDTVGAVAMDAAGHLAAGNSTGGTMFKWPGRIGDTPILGSGLYADDRAGAAVCTGWGEHIMKAVLAKSAVDEIPRQPGPDAAAAATIARFRDRMGGLGGVICISPDARVGAAYSTPYMAYGFRTEGTGASIVRLGDFQG